MKQKKWFAVLAAFVFVAAIPAAVHAQSAGERETYASPEKTLLDYVDFSNFSDYEAKFDVGTVERKIDSGETETYEQVAYLGEKEIEVNGETVAVDLCVIENHPVGFAANAGGCSGGNHTNKVYDGPTDVTRVHREAAAHPCKCFVIYRRDWHCTACGSTGTDETSRSVWCPSIDTNEDPGLPPEEGPSAG